MRSILLWMAGNAWLRSRVPRLGFVKRAVRRFMPGEDVDAALAAASASEADGIGVLLTRLGENLADLAEAGGVADHYLQVLAGLHALGIPGELSVKLTQLGYDLDPTRAADLLERLIVTAGETGGTVWIDMEGSAYTEGTVAIYEAAKQRHPNVGVCLQAYLRRTAADIQRLLPLDPRIRLVKGAYAEPEAIAYRSRTAVSSSYVALAMMLLQARAGGRPVHIGLGTHDVTIIAQLAEQATALGLGRDDFEVQMLYGIRMNEQRRLAREGYPVRTLIAYGPAWYAWYMRRLAERPANVAFALRSLLP